MLFATKIDDFISDFNVLRGKMECPQLPTPASLHVAIECRNAFRGGHLLGNADEMAVFCAHAFLALCAM